MLTDREKFLMREAMDQGEYYKSLDDWLGEVISDAGHTVEQNLVHDADRLFPVDSQSNNTKGEGND